MDEYDDEEIKGFLETAKDLAKSFLLKVNVDASDEFFDMRYTMEKEKAAMKDNTEYKDTSDLDSDEEEACDEALTEEFIGENCEVVQKYCGDYVDVCDSDEENDERFF